MPANYYRMEVRLNQGTKERLEKLKKEFENQMGRSVSMSHLVGEIIDTYLASLPDSVVENKKLI